MSLATSHSFVHNDIDSLRDKLSRAKGTVYVAVESIYSMDGDQAPLKEILAVCEEEGAFLIVDEAHAGGVLGNEGEGLSTECGIDDRIFAKVITFGKAFGSHGAVVLGSDDLKTYLINFARSLIYTTALSPHSQERIITVVNAVADLDAERYQLERNITLFKTSFNKSDYQLIESNSPVQSVLVPGNKEAKQLAKNLQDAGFAVKAILYPTVREGAERIRFCIHSYNSEKEIIELTNLING